MKSQYLLAFLGLAFIFAGCVIEGSIEAMMGNLNTNLTASVLVVIGGVITILPLTAKPADYYDNPLKSH